MTGAQRRSLAAVLRLAGAAWAGALLLAGAAGATVALAAAPAAAGTPTPGTVTPVTSPGTVTPGLTYVTSARNGSHETAWLAAPGGNHARRLGPGTSVLLAPSGQLVAVSDETFNAHSALRLYSATGAIVASFFQRATNYQFLLRGWSPDSRYLAVELYATARSARYRTGLYTIDTSTGVVATIARGFISGAGFSPLPGADTLVYGLSHSQALRARIDLYSAPASGAGPARQLTHNGRSLNPVWGTRGIAFDHERLRGHDAPVYQIKLLDHGRTTTITHSRPNLLVQGLVPIAVAADGRHLLAEYQGEDTAFAWTVDLVSHRSRALKLHGQLVSPDGISQDGRRVLVDLGDFENPPSAGTVYSMPFGGGRPIRLARHAGDPSWNQ